MGWEVKIDMSGQSKDCLWVCNVKMEKFYRGGKGAHFHGFLGFRAIALRDLKIFFMGFGVPMSLTVADIFQPISTRSRWGIWVHSWAKYHCMYLAFWYQVKQSLSDYYRSFMLIRGSTGSFKCKFAGCT